MSNSQVETVTTSADKVRIAGAVVLAVGALFAYYALSKQGPIAQWAALLGLLLAAIGAFLTSEVGKSLLAYARESVREARKVVWPSRKEALQMTGYVFVFVFVMALFLWLTDKTLEWAIYDLILGWRR